MHTRRPFTFLAAAFLAVAAQAQPILPGTQGQALLDALVQAYKPTTVLDYSHARDTMYALVHNVNDSVQCAYSGHRLYLPPGVDPSTWLFMGGDNDGINCEHTWPQSKGADSGNPESDMHHLFPVRTAVNTARGNSPFAEIPDAEAAQWYYLDQSTATMPTENTDLYSERLGDTFEPQEDHKGNVARAMFYFYTMYRAEADAADPQFFPLQRETLCDWHYLDPADGAETARTWLIAQYQDGRPNPYVLDCSLAARSFCAGIPGECPAILADGGARSLPLAAALFPNPATSLLHLRFDNPLTGELSLQLFDAWGRQLDRQALLRGSDSFDLHVGELPAAVYFLRLSDSTGRRAWDGKFVKE